MATAAHHSEVSATVNRLLAASKHKITYIQLEDFLSKRSGSGLGSWQKRYFVLNQKDNALFWYESKEHYLSRSRSPQKVLFEEMLDVVHHTNKKGGKRIDILSTVKGGKRYELLAPSAPEAKQWVHALQLMLPHRNRAAILIQKLYRGLMGRKRYAESKITIEAERLRAEELKRTSEQKKLAQAEEDAKKRAEDRAEKKKQREEAAEKGKDVTMSRVSRLAKIQQMKKKKAELEKKKKEEAEQKKLEEEEAALKEIEDEKAARELEKKKIEEERETLERQRRELEEMRQALEAQRLEEEKTRAELEELKKKEEEKKKEQEMTEAKVKVEEQTRHRAATVGSTSRVPFRGGRKMKVNMEDPELTKTWENLMNDYDATTWALFAAEPGTQDLKVFATGGGNGLDRFIEHLDDSNVFHGAFRVRVDDWFRFVFVTYVGSSVPPLARARVSLDAAAIKTALLGTYIDFVVMSPDESLTREMVEEKIREQRQDAKIEFV